jgi:hypothetical protein
MDLGAGVLSSTPRHLASDPDAYSGGGTNTGWTLYLLTQNLHPTSSIQQAEQASFTHEKIPRRASQFSLKINKRQGS